MYCELVQISVLDLVRSVKKVSLLFERCPVCPRMLVHVLRRIYNRGICGEAFYGIGVQIRSHLPSLVHSVVRQ